MNKFADVCLKILNTAKNQEKADSLALHVKLSEEHGELGECVLFDHGYIKHKVPKEPLMGEVADNMQILLILIQKHYPDQTPEQLMETLTTFMDKKYNKWLNILTEQGPMSPDVK